MKKLMEYMEASAEKLTVSSVRAQARALMTALNKMDTSRVQSIDPFKIRRELAEARVNLRNVIEFLEDLR